MIVISDNYVVFQYRLTFIAGTALNLIILFAKSMILYLNSVNFQIVCDKYGF